jgi:stress-induced-phosphoprotein 1
VSRPRADRRREGTSDRFSSRRRADLETAPARLLSLAGGACPARESRRLRADAPNALHRDERARATELPPARREPRSTDTPLPDATRERSRCDKPPFFVLRLSRRQKLGNDAFAAGRYAEAIEHFTKASALDPTNHVFYSNRSAAHAGLGDFASALADAEKTVAYKPDWPKGYSRKGAALYGLRRFNDAVEAYEAGLAIDPASEVLKSGLEDVKAAKARSLRPPTGATEDPMGNIAAMLSAPDLMGKLAVDPSTRGFLAQPDFMAMLSEVQKKPDTFAQHMNDPRMMKVLSVALGINVMSGEEAAKSGFGGDDAMDTASAPPPPRAPPPPPPAPEPAPELPSHKADALKQKELGNAAYKAKDFSTALSHYDKAIELDPEEISFLTNKAAVFFERAEYDECIETCDTAIEKGRELRVDYKVVARAMTRKGNALVKQDKLEEAVEVYSKSLMEHRTADTLKRKDDAEREIKDRKVKAYLDPAKAEIAREEGNELFKQQKYPEAVERYTEAIARDPEDHRVYSNRAACYTKLTAFNEALKDAEKCIALKPDFPKGYTRKGHVEFFTKQYDKALETYQLGLSKDPTNEELKDGLRRTMIEIQKGQTGQVDEAEMKQRQERAMQDPEIQNILSDPVMRQVLNDMSTDPKAAAEHQKNPMVMAKIQKLINAGIVQTR